MEPQAKTDSATAGKEPAAKAAGGPAASGPLSSLPPALLKLKLAARRRRGGADKSNKAAADDDPEQGQAIRDDGGGSKSDGRQRAEHHTIGRIAGETIATDANGLDVVLADGTAVRAHMTLQIGDQLGVEVIAGRLQSAEVYTIPAGAFMPEPRMANLPMAADGSAQVNGERYAEFSGELWRAGGPKPEDVAQGSLGDCFLMAAMSALAARDPQAIMRLFNPHTPGLPAYQVQLFDEGGAPQVFHVDMTFVMNAHGGRSYARGAPIFWPALLEKAYAMQHGSFGAINGGIAASAFRALTGEAATNQLPSSLPGDAAAQIAKRLARGEMVAVGTPGTVPIVHANQRGRIHGAAPRFHAELGRSVLFESVAVTATGTTIVDDRNGGLFNQQTGGEATRLEDGTIDYQSGRLEMTFAAGRSPTSVHELAVSWNQASPLFQRYGLVDHHEYHVVAVQGDAIVLRNPWGQQHPSPIPSADFTQIFDAVETGRTASEPYGGAGAAPKDDARGGKR